jgi:hypothetical protein
MVSSLVVGCCLLFLALSLPEAASLVAGEMLSLLRAVALGSEATPVLSRTASRPPTPAAHAAPPPDERFTLHNYDWDDDDSSDMLLVVPTPHGLPLAAVRTRFDGSTHPRLWPIHYLVRPQLLARL